MVKVESVLGSWSRCVFPLACLTITYYRVSDCDCMLKSSENSVLYLWAVQNWPEAIFTRRICTAHRRKPQLETSPSMCTAAASEPIPISSWVHDSPVPRYWRRSHGVTAADRNPDCSCMNAESGSQFTDSGIWYVPVNSCLLITSPITVKKKKTGRVACNQPDCTKFLWPPIALEPIATLCVLSVCSTSPLVDFSNSLGRIHESHPG